MACKNVCNSALKNIHFVNKKKIKRSEAQCGECMLVAYSWEGETKEFGVQGQPGLYSKAFFK